MIAPGADAARETVADWLATKVGAPVQVAPFVVPGHGGFSNDTWLTEVTIAGKTRGIVVRLAPTGEALFPVYDLTAQANVLELLRRNTAVPVATVLWEEPDPSVLGRPFYVMDRIDGSIPPDTPGHHFDGWVKDLAPADQACLLDNAMGAMATIHCVDWRAAGLDSLPGIGLDHDIDWWTRYREWAGISVPRIDAAFEWCAANRPPEPDPALVWGDARLGNLIFAPDLSVRAVLDWEMATLGPPELDLGWYLFLERVVLTFTPQLPGFGDHASITATYEHHLGRSVDHMEWYELWGGVRSALCHHRLVGLRGDAPGFDPVLDTIDALLAAVS